MNAKQILIALNEVKQLYQKFDADANHLDQKASTLLSSSSLILTVFSGIQAFLFEGAYYSLNIIILIFIFILYLLLIILILTALFPQGFKTVFIHNWEGVNNAILNKKSEKDANYQLLSNYLDRIEKNKLINDKKAILIKISTILFSILMVLIILISLLPILKIQICS